jgi:hypothetical protein
MILFYVALHGLKVYKLAKKENFSKQEIQHKLIKRAVYIFSIFSLIYGGLIHYFNDRIEKPLNEIGRCESLQKEFQGRLLTVQICDADTYWNVVHTHPIRIKILDQQDNLLARRYYVYNQIVSNYYIPVDYTEDGLSYWCPDEKTKRYLDLPPSILDGLLTHIPFSDPGQFDQIWQE